METFFRYNCNIGSCAMYQPLIIQSTEMVFMAQGHSTKDEMLFLRSIYNSWFLIEIDPSPNHTE